MEENRNGDFSMEMRNSASEDPKDTGTFSWMRTSALEECQDGGSFLSWMEMSVMEDPKDEESSTVGA